MARRRADGEPLQYILGTAPFRHLMLSVGPGTFIPRPETEAVAGRAMELLPEGGIAVDLCTGSGAIALSISHERPDARVVATETSSEALAWARRNSDGRVSFHAGDLFEPLDPGLRGSVDVCVSNPPYIAYSEADGLPADVIDHEPHDALFAGSDGLSTIRRIVGEAPEWLRPGGWIVLEIGETQAEPVRDLLGSAGYEAVEITTDLAGKDRMAEGRRP